MTLDSAVQATSPMQLSSASARSRPGLEEVREGIWSLGMEMPGGFTPYSICYFLKDSAGGVHIIDPGWGSDRNWELVQAALRDIGSDVRDVRTIITTHLHPDHSGLAVRLREASGAAIAMHASEHRALASAAAAPAPLVLEHRLAGWGVPEDRQSELLQFLGRPPSLSSFTPDILLEDGERLPIPGHDIRVVATPGHTPGHICLRDVRRELLISGDHILPTIHGGLGLGGETETNPLTDYLHSLERVTVNPDDEVLPGHGYRFVGLGTRALQHAAHHQRRARETHAVVADHPEASTWEIARRLTWTAGWRSLKNFYLFSALHQTAIHQDFVAT